MAKWTSQSTHDDIGEFSDNPKLVREIRKRRIRNVVIIVGLVAVVGFSANPIYRAYRTYQIDANLERAQAAARLEDWPAARATARSVLIARPGDYEAFRIWTIALGHIGEPRTYLAAAMMFTNPQATREDKLEALEIMARQAPEAVAFSAYASLEPEIRVEIDFLTALAPMLTRRGAGEVVENQLRKAEGLESHPKAQLELIRALCSRPSEKNVDEARDRFAKLIASGADSLALSALEILGEAPGGLKSGESVQHLKEWVDGQPEATTLQHLLALHPQIEGLPEASEALFVAAIERFGSVDPGVVGSWLVRHGQADRAVTLLEEPAKSRSDAYIAYLHALLRTEKEDRLQKALSSPPAAADLVEVELIRAAMARRRGDAPAESSAWNQALNQAAFDGSRNRFLEIAIYATALGASDAAEDALVAAIRIGWGPIPPYADLQARFGGLALKNRSEDLLAIFRTLLRFEPENPDLINNFYYLGLLHDLVEPVAASRALTGLIETYPDRPEFASALAMAYLKEGRPEQVSALLPQLRECSDVSEMMVDALEATALILQNQIDSGREILDRVNWRLFMRQERIAFRNLLIQKEMAEMPLPLMEISEVSIDDDMIPAWRREVEKLEKARQADVLPALPAVELPEMPELDE